MLAALWLVCAINVIKTYSVYSFDIVGLVIRISVGICIYPGIFLLIECLFYGKNQNFFSIIWVSIT